MSMHTFDDQAQRTDLAGAVAPSKPYAYAANKKGGGGSKPPKHLPSKKFPDTPKKPGRVDELPGRPITPDYGEDLPGVPATPDYGERLPGETLTGDEITEDYRNS